MKKFLLFCIALLLVTFVQSQPALRPQTAYPNSDGKLVSAIPGKLHQTFPAVHPKAFTSGVIVNGGNRLAATQSTNGGWGWPLTGTGALNTIGPIGKGLTQSYNYNFNGSQLAALDKTKALLLSKTNNFSASDGFLAKALDEVYGGTTCRDYVNLHFYGPLAAGTYNKNGAGTLFNTAAYVNLIQSDRHSWGQGNMAAWDLGIGIVGAASCNVTGTELAYWINGTEAEINVLDTTGWWDVLGLAGGLYGLAYVHQDFDPTSGPHAAASNLNDLAMKLATYQISLGGFAWNAAWVIPNDFDETIQETAYSILALNAVNRTEFLANIHGAGDYLAGVQLPSGGWENYVGSSEGENNEITGEALWGYTTAYATVENNTQGTWHMSIQSAINAATAGDVISVYPGIYNQDEANGFNIVTGGAGSSNLNIFVNKSLTIQGVDASGVPITDYNNVAAFVTAKRNTPSGNLSTIFIQADNVTITGLDITGFDDPDYNFKTISVIGDNATIKYCKLHNLDQVANIYVYDPNYNSTTNTSHVQSYRFEANYSDEGGPDNAGIRIGSGAGWTGSSANRIITGNVFTAGTYSVEFVGPGADPWDYYPVGAATITANNFSGSVKGSLVAWGKYLGVDGYGTFDWDAIYSGNTFAKAVIVKTSAGQVRSYSSGTIYNIRGIYNALQRYPILQVAQAGDIINVAQGTYVENGQIVINKNLSIVGANKATTIIKPAQGTGGSGYLADNTSWILVNSGVTFNLSNVTLDGAGQVIVNAVLSHGHGTIDNNIIRNMQRLSSYDGVGVALFGSDMTVSNNSLSGIGREGIFAAFFANATITGNTYTGKGSGNWLDYAVEVGRNSTATISGNTITACTGVASVDGSTSAGIIASSYYDVTGIHTNAAITGNTITGNFQAISVGWDENDLSAVIAHNNDFSGSTMAVLTTGPSIDASCNYYGTTVASEVAALNSGNVTYFPYLVSGNITTPDCSGVGPVVNATQNKSYMTIQAAITAATSGDVINVSSGTYAESINLTKSLTIQGAGKGMTKIVPAALINTGIKHKWATTINGVKASMLINGAAAVTLKDLTIDGGSLTAYDAVLFWNASSGTLENVEIRSDAVFNSMSGHGLVVDATSPASVNLSVINCDFPKWNRNAIDAVNGNGTGSNGGNITINVTGGTLSGRNDASVCLQNGINLWNYAGGSVNSVIDGVTIKDLVYNTGGWASYAFAGTDNNGVVIKNSVFTNVTSYIGAGYGNIDATLNNNFDGVTSGSGTLAQNFAIADMIYHKVNDLSYGLVTWQPHNLYITQLSGVINNGISAATAGDIVNVTEGTYPESLTINKPLTLLGAQANTEPVNGGRTGGESVISSTYPMSVTASNVTINGFELKDFGHAIFIPAAGFTVGNSYTLNNITISYNWLHSENCDGEARGGIFAEPGLLSNFNITHNYIYVNSATDAPFNIGFSSSTANPVYANVNVSDNYIKNDAPGGGYGLFCGADPSVYLINGMKINHNHFITNPNGASFNIGNIMPNGSFPAEFNNNTVEGAGGTVGLVNGTANENIFINGARFGLWGSIWGFTRPSHNVTVANNIFNDNINGRGFTLDPYADNAFGITGYGPATIDATTIHVHDNTFESTAVGGDRIRNLGVGALDASCNWYGTTAGSAIAEKIKGTVSYNPWLTNGTDNEPGTPGFQPVPGSCSGTPVVINSATPGYVTCSSPVSAISVVFSGGTANYAFAWTGGSASGITGSPYSITGLSAGTYTITITDANGSTATSSATIVTKPVHNNTSGGDYPTIQDAITAATAGDVIQVCPGTYDVSTTINLSKAIQIHGASYGLAGTESARTSETILNDTRAASNEGGVFAINTTGAVVIDGITLQGSKIVGGQPANANLTINNNRMLLVARPNGGQTGMIYSTGCTITMDHNYVKTTGYNPSNSAMLQVAGNYTGSGSSNMMTMTNNYFKGVPVFSPPNSATNGASTLQLNFASCQGAVSGNTFDGVDIGLLLANACGNFTVSNNTFENQTRGSSEIASGSFGSGIMIGDPTYTGSVTITGNTFQNNDCGIRCSNAGSGITPTETGSHITISSNTFTGNVYDVVNKWPVLTLTLDGTNTMAGTTLSSATLSDFYAIEDKIVHKVDYSGYGLVVVKALNKYVTANSFYTPAGTTTPSIQRGIDAATAGDVVNVAPATFNESVNITKSVTLSGAKAGLDARLRNTASGESILDGTGLPSNKHDAIMIANGVSNVTIDGFELRNYLTGSTSNGDGNGISSYCMSSSLTGANTVTVVNNYIHNVGYNGILVGSENNGSTSMVVQSGWLIQKNLIENFRYAGIELTNVTTSQVKNNHIIAPSAIFDDPGDAGVGIEVAARSRTKPVTAGTIEVSDNLINGTFVTGSRAAINLLSRAYLSTSNALLTGVTVNSNTITGGTNLRAAVLQVAESRNNGPSAVTSVAITNNFLDGNFKGIVIQDFINGGSGPATHTGITITGNALRTNTNAGLNILASTSATGITFTGNKITGNSLYGVNNEGTGILNAAYNWWGSPLGPYHVTANACGNGDFVSNNVTFSPWYNTILMVNTTLANTYSLSGMVRYANNAYTRLNGIIVTLKTAGGATVGTYNTNTRAGFYQFTGLTNETYNLELSSTAPGGGWQTWDGVNNTDYLLVLRHTQGILLPPNPPVVQVAADVVAKHPTIATADASAIQLAAKYGWWKVGVSPQTPYFDIPKWVFSGETAATPITGIVMSCGNIERNILGLCAGDVNASYIPPSGDKQARPNMELISRGNIAPADEIILPVRAEFNMELGAITLYLDYDASQLEITGVTMPKQGDRSPYFLTTDNVLQIGWVSLDPVSVSQGETVLSIHARAKTNASGIRFTLNSNPLSELADGDGNVIDNARLAIADIGGTVSSDLISVYPNPVNDVLYIEYSVHQSGTFSAELVNLQGVVVTKTGNTSIPAGTNKTRLNVSELPSGVYMLRVYLGSQITTRKIVINR